MALALRDIYAIFSVWRFSAEPSDFQRLDLVVPAARIEPTTKSKGTDR